MLRDLTPLVGRQPSCGVVPDWHGQWPLAEHADYCAMVQGAAGELLLHGYSHRRAHGTSAVSVLTRGSDEMNGLRSNDTVDLIASGQQVFADVFGGPARGFLPPAWQRGRLDTELAITAGLSYTLGFFSIDLAAGRDVDASTPARVPLSTWSWDCGRIDWFGRVGDAVGRAMHAMTRGVPALADAFRPGWRPGVRPRSGDVRRRPVWPRPIAPS